MTDHTITREAPKRKRPSTPIPSAPQEERQLAAAAGETIADTVEVDASTRVHTAPASLTPLTLTVLPSLATVDDRSGTDLIQPQQWAHGLTVTARRLTKLDGAKVPKSADRWCVVGVWLASRDFPMLPFWLPLVDPETGCRLGLRVPYQSMMAALSPKYNDRERILLHVRVVQRTDAQGQLVGEVRYLCTDIAVSYEMGDNAFKWINFHPTIFQVCCSTWNSSLNRSELQAHLVLANTRGGMVFQSADAQGTRAFRSILRGKGLRAQCTLQEPPFQVQLQDMYQQRQRRVAEAVQQITTHALMANSYFKFQNGLITAAHVVSAATTAAATASATSTSPRSSSAPPTPAAALPDDPMIEGAASTAASASASSASTSAPFADSPTLKHAFLTITNALADSKPLWFHPTELEATEASTAAAGPLWQQRQPQTGGAYG